MFPFWLRQILNAPFADRQSPAYKLSPPCRRPTSMRLNPQDCLFVLTGAGISAESGLATFRGSGGLWDGHRVEDVATPEAWQADPSFVWGFYAARRRHAMST